MKYKRTELAKRLRRKKLETSEVMKVKMKWYMTW